MNKKSSRGGAKIKVKDRKLKKKVVNRYYYDACVLDSDVHAYSDFVSTTNNRENVLSHLAIGEAYGNCLKKGKKVSETFSEFLLKLKMKNYVKIVGNDGVEKYVESILNEFARMSITDAIHLATALKYKCEKVRTFDDDLLGLSTYRLKKLANEYGLDSFKIEKPPTN